MKKRSRKCLGKVIGIFIAVLVINNVLLLYNVPNDTNDKKTYEYAYVNKLMVENTLEQTSTAIDNSTADLFRHVLYRISRARYGEQGGMAKEYLLVSNILGPTDDYVEETQDDMKITLDNSQIVTLSVHCTDNNLQYLNDLSVFWTGPISVAVLTYGRAVLSTVKYVLHLYLCNKRFKHQVTFHLVIPLKEFPEHLSAFERETVHVNCTERKQSAMTTKNYNNTDVPYPSNVLRNLALENVRTSYVLNADIDMLPSENLYNNLVTFLKSFNGSKNHTTDKMAFVLPAFETNVTLTTPLTKEDILTAWARKKNNFIRPFYWTVCRRCQSRTHYRRWKSLPKGDTINLGYEVTWMYPWEPFYVSRKTDLPRFNERFKQYGLNRLSQLCEMHMADFTFAVLDTGFLVHRGFKEKSTFHKYKRDENRNNFHIYEEFKTELTARYTNTTRRC